MLLGLFWSASFPKDAENLTLAQPFWGVRPRQKGNLPDGSSEVFRHGHLSAAERQQAEHQTHFLPAEAPLYLFHFITCWVTVKACAQWPFTDLIYFFFLMSFTKIWTEVFQQEMIIFFFFWSVQWNKSVSGDCIDFLTQSEGKQVSCQLSFLLTTHPWNTAEANVS